MKSLGLDEIHRRFTLIPGDVYRFAQKTKYSVSPADLDPAVIPHITGCVLYAWNGTVHQTGFIAPLNIEGKAVSASVVYAIDAN